MLYLIGGAARSGKTILSKRLLNEKKISYFCVDYLVSALDRKLHQEPSRQVAVKIQSQLESMLRNIVEVEQDYVVEGDKILPELVRKLFQDYPGKITSCFLGYPSIEPARKIEEIKNKPSPINNWTKNSSDEKLSKLITETVGYSIFLQKECAKYDIPYFDISKNFSGKMDDAYQYLTQSSNK